MAIRYAREQGLPFLGLCLGMQCAVIEFARHVLGSEAPNSTEFDPRRPYPVIDYMADQSADGEKGGTMRLGAVPLRAAPRERPADAYGTRPVQERHRHRLEFNNAYRDLWRTRGWSSAGCRPTGGWWRSSSCPGTPGSSGRSSIPSSSPARTRRTPSSGASFRPPASARSRATSGPFPLQEVLVAGDWGSAAPAASPGAAGQPADARRSPGGATGRGC